MKGAQLSFGEIPKVEGNSGPYAGSVGSSGDSGTSQESAEKTMFASALRDKVFDLIRRDGGCTRGEMFDALAEQFQPSTLSARIRELRGGSAGGQKAARTRAPSDSTNPRSETTRCGSRRDGEPVLFPDRWRRARVGDRLCARPGSQSS